MPKKFSISRRRRPRQPTAERDCSTCPALCCHDLSVVIARPRTRADVDHLSWQLRFDTVRVYIRNRRWHLLTEGRCSYLDGDLMCTIYDKRPEICRAHAAPNCERFAEWYDVMLETPEQMMDYLKRR